MGILGKSPGDVKSYPGGNKKSIPNTLEGYSNGLKRDYVARNGIQDDEKVDGFNSEPSYSPDAEKQIGDDGKG